MHRTEDRWDRVAMSVQGSVTKMAVPAGRLAFVALSALFVLLAVETLRGCPSDAGRQRQTEAQALMQRAMQAVKAEKARRNVRMDRALDPDGTGMIGEEYTDLTTTRGSLPAKRWSTHPAFASAVTDMISRAGARPGDTAAVSFSGSFPALNIAVLSAIAALDLRPVIVTSVGASAYGANQPEMTWLDMERCLRERGVFPYRSIAASLGGIADTRGGLDGTGIPAGLAAMRRNGIPLLDEKGGDSLAEDIEKRLALFDRALGGRNPAVFINVGGSSTSLGGGSEGRRIPAGLLKRPLRSDHPARGMIVRMGERGVPVVHLLKIREIASRYGIAAETGGRRPAGGIAVTVVFLAAVLAYLIGERILHERRLNRIPIRIHVNGTRGKSTVVRLVAAALRRSGIRTLAKTTGTVPRLILPDGRVETIRRRAPANILEQIRIVKRADRLAAQAIVVECMALEPDLQFVSEEAMIRSTVGIITNVRPDHFEVMGGSLDEVAAALSRSVPRGAILLTGDRTYFPLFSEAASRRGSRAVLAGCPSSGGIPDDRETLPPGFPDNGEIVHGLCALLGIAPSAVAASPGEADAAGGDAASRRIVAGNRTVCFVDAFAANDVVSTRIVQERAMARAPLPRPWIALFNHRADRPLRMATFAERLLAGDRYDYVAVIGEGVHLAWRTLRGKVAPGRRLALPGGPPGALLDALLARVPCAACTIIGMGNEKGPGADLSRYFRKAQQS